MVGSILYSGFLKTTIETRMLHYVFVKANVTDPNSAPLVIWFNGGPGCSSLIGLIQEIGPYIVGNSFTLGDQLKKNPYSWDKAANLLFI
jgi:carboxypeptidase C (cathepsin A)